MGKTSANNRTGADIIGVLIDNSELAEIDAQNIIAAIDRQTQQQLITHDLLRQLIQTFSEQQTSIIFSPVESGNFPVSTPKGSPKADRVKAWLAENPDSKLSNRKIAELLGVTHTLVNQIRK